MAGSKIIAIILLVVGILVLLVSALADIVGIGGSPRVFGYWQVAGTLVGAVVAIVGGVLYWRAGKRG